MRDSRIDSMKGLLILLVVIGHMIEPHITDATNLVVYLLIYSFHMPLFVLISGYVFKPSTSKSKLWSSSLHLFETFILFQFIFCFIIWHDNGYRNFDPINFIKPQKILWYLVSLIVWRAATFMICKVVRSSDRNHGIVMLVAVVIALAAGFVPLGNEFAFQRTLVFFPMFLLGSWMRASISFNNFIHNTIKHGGVIIAFCLGIIAYFIVDTDIMRWHLYGNQSYVTSQFLIYQPFEYIVYRLFFMALGASLALTIYSLYPATGFLSLLGKVTLPIYVIHSFLIHGLNPYVSSSTFVLFLCAIAITWILYLLTKTRLAAVLTNPVTNILRIGSYTSNKPSLKKI